MASATDKSIFPKKRKMKNLLLTLVAIYGLIGSTNACTCVDGFFCSWAGGSATILYGYKTADIDTTGVTFQVIDSWGATNPTGVVTIWNDSAIAYAPVMGPGPVFQCSNDIRRMLTSTDTFLLAVRSYDTTSAFGAPGDYVFYHELCQVDILWVKNGMVSDTNSFYFNPQPGALAIIEESFADYKTRTSAPAQNRDCTPTRIVTSVGEVDKTDGLDVWAFGKTLNITNPTGQAADVKLYSLVGQQVYQAKGNGSNSHNLSHLTPGVYLAEVSINGEYVRKKVVLQ